MGSMGEIWANVGSAIAGIMFVSALFQQYVPYRLRQSLQAYLHKLLPFFSPYIHITFPEFTGDRLKRSDAFTAIQNYLSTKSTAKARRLKADTVKDSKSLVLTMDDHEEVIDDFNGVRVCWKSMKTAPSNNLSFSFYPSTNGHRFYQLSFHNRHRQLITTSYINHVLNGGKEIAARNRQRKLYCNNPSKTWHHYKQTKWSHVPFEHPATFDTLAMDTKKKEEIKNDLLKFSKSRDYYAKIGKAWKRGYLLYGPPGTGKSTMIAAIANFLNYDVYDLELTTVEDNTELRRLLIETSNKCIIMIEDIDCSLDLTGQRKKKNKEDNDQKDDKDDDKDLIKKKAEEQGQKKDSKVTLSGLLNFIDGLWSACGEERIIIFTTNYLEKLDPALIRRGRMDKHIEMSYCCFEAFKFLAKNYLDVDSHRLYGEMKQLLEETSMIPADVAENLMPKSDEEDEETCLKNLVQALKQAKEEEARKKLEEEAERLKAEKVEEKSADKQVIKGNDDDDDDDDQKIQQDRT